MKRTLLLCLSLTATIAFAGAEKGNGGKGIVCRDSSGKILSARLLDYYEADLRGIKIDLGPPAYNIPFIGVQLRINYALDRLDARDHFRAVHYRNRVADFFNAQNTKNLKNVVLESTDDSYQIAVPPGCAAEQLVVRKQPQFKEDRLWTVNEDLWNALSDDDKAGLVLHEVIYDEVLTQSFRPHSNSINARYYNSYVSSNQLNSMSNRDYVRFMDNLQFNSVTLNGYEANFAVYTDPYNHELKIELPRFYDNSDQAEDFNLVNPTTFNFQEKNVLIDKIYFFPNGRVQKIHIANYKSNEILVYGQSLKVSNNIEFNKNGNIYAISLETPQSYQWLGQKHILADKITFYDNGAPKEFSSPDTMLFEVNGGVIQTADVRNNIKLYASGKLQEIYLHGDGNDNLFSLNSPQYNLSMRRASFYEDGYLQSINDGGNTVRYGSVNLSGQNIRFVSTDTIEFWPDHFIKTIPHITNSFSWLVQGQKIDFCDSISFYENHTLKTSSLCKPGIFENDFVTFNVGKQAIDFEKQVIENRYLRANKNKFLNAEIGFYAGEILHFGTIAKDVTVQDTQGNIIFLKKDDYACFNKDGKIVATKASDPDSFSKCMNLE